MKRSNSRRTITLLGAISIGIGGMVGGGIFAVLGEAVSLAHGATMVAFLVAGIVAVLSAYSYAKLSVHYQNRGGTVVFVNHAFGFNLLSGSLNLLLWLSYLVTISLYAVAFASYGATFFPQPSESWLRHLLISIAIVLPTAINLISASFVSRSESLIVFIKVILLLLIIVSGSGYIEVERLSPVEWGTPFSIFIAGMIIFVAYEGFELIANASEDIENPESNLPKAFFISVISVIVLYILIAIITVGTVSSDTLLKAKDYALAVAAEPALGKTGFTIVTIAALLATFSAINATIYGNARLSYTLAKEGELPEELENEREDIPFVGVLITTLLSLILANTIDLREIAIIGSAGFLLIFTLINLSAFKLSKHIHASTMVTLISTSASFISLLTLLIHTSKDTPQALWVFISFIIFSILFEWGYGKFFRGHFFNQPY
ncbi:APC family permease [Sulfurovum sp. zt1-1]|uniref:APC family permease n=1 Tax=Sulfurovum zhangzhouensis TaxID=3019067 RepID=A0ABT7QUX7_9BACT|nr:APC family permease [Sulfurovum zhangzhouensis]MDM5270644.1 APC family permease [Sulfurovum zhangzhouensis]